MLVDLVHFIKHSFEEVSLLCYLEYDGLDVKVTLGDLVGALHLALLANALFEVLEPLPAVLVVELG